MLAPPRIGLKAFPLCLLAVTLGACAGAVGEGDGTGPAASMPGNSSGRPGTGGPGAGGAPNAGTPGVDKLPPGVNKPPGVGGVPPVESAGTLSFRRLTNDEFNYTVRDLLGDTTKPGAAFDRDAEGGSGFEDPGLVALSDVKAFDVASDDIARRAIVKLPTLLNCDTVKTGEEPCAREFVRKFGQRAYRRPLSDEEAKRLDGLYDTGRGALKYGFNEAIRMVLTAMLQSPNFLYHWELGAPSTKAADGLAPLDSWAVASRLSYFLWQSMPDGDLFNAALANRLSTPKDIEDQARRLIKDPRARTSVESFYVQWLGLQGLPAVQRDVKIYKEWSATAGEAMLGEAKAFAAHAMLTDGKLSTLYQAPVTFANAALAKLYGLSDVVGSDLKMVTLPAKERRGFLTQLGFLTAYPAGAATHPPVLRGKRIYNRVLCGAVAPPGMVPALETPPPGLPLRKHFEAHASNPACAACHKLLDPIGFAFEAYDSSGKFRTSDSQGTPVDPAGTLPLPLSGGSVAFTSALDLVDKLAASPDALECLASEWFRFAVQRADMPEDAGSKASFTNVFRTSGGDFRELMVAVVRSKSFTHRKPLPGEDTP